MSKQSGMKVKVFIKDATTDKFLAGQRSATLNRTAETTSIREVMKKEEYRFLVARIVINNLQGTVKKKSDMQRLVNEVLDELNLGSISYGFIRNHI